MFLMSFAEKMIQEQPNNESAWVYLKGYFGVKFGTTLNIVPYGEYAERLIQICNNYALNRFALGFLGDVYESIRDVKCKDIWIKLATDIDTIRCKYWEYRIKECNVAVNK